MGCDIDRLAVVQATANIRLAAIALGDKTNEFEHLSQRT